MELWQLSLREPLNQYLFSLGLTCGVVVVVVGVRGATVSSFSSHVFISSLTSIIGIKFLARGDCVTLAGVVCPCHPFLAVFSFPFATSFSFKTPPLRSPPHGSSIAQFHSRILAGWCGMDGVGCFSAVVCREKAQTRRLLYATLATTTTTLDFHSVVVEVDEIIQIGDLIPIRVCLCDDTEVELDCSRGGAGTGMEGRGSGIKEA